MSSPQARALSLYRKLWRSTRALPRQAQDYYQGSIRSGFIAFRDEDDPETLERIVQQSQKDAEWVLNKYKAHPLKQGQRK